MMTFLWSGSSARRAVWLCCICVLTIGVAGRSQTGAMTNEDVIALVEGGLGAPVLLAAISRAETVDFDVDAGLLQLARSSVPDEVITAMMERQSAQDDAARNAATAPERIAPPSPGRPLTQTAAYTQDQIQTAMFIGADGNAGRYQDSCEAGTGQGRGFFGRLTDNRIVRSVVRDRVSRYTRATLGAAAGAAGVGQLDRELENRFDGLHGYSMEEQFLAMSMIAGAVGERAANGTLPPLPNDIRVTGEPPLARLAEHARELRRTYRPLPEPDDPAVLEIIGHDLFQVRAWDYVKGIEYIVIRPRGDDDERSIVHPVMLEDRGSAMTAHFVSEHVRRIVADDDVEVIVVTPSGEFRCNLDDRRIRRGFNPLR